MLIFRKVAQDAAMAQYTIQRIDLTNSGHVRSFLNLPVEIYRNLPQYVPPMYMDARRMLNPRQNPFFEQSTAAFFLALDKTGHPVARLACLNHSPYNRFNHENTAFFYLFESLDLPQASGLLIEHAAEWARSQGLTRMLGPKGFSMLDGLGLLVEGFEFRPAFGIPYNPPYYPALIESAGFQVSNEIISGHLGKGFSYDEKIARVAQRVQERRELSIARFHNRKQLRALLPQLQNLYNNAIQGTAGNYPISNAEAHTLAEQMLWFADPSLIKIVMKDNRPVGFLFAYPDISSALQRSKGRLFPIGWIYILHGLRTTQVIDINGLGLIEEFRGSGGTAILFNEIINTFHNSHYTDVEIVQIGTENVRMLQESSVAKINFHKKHRLYIKNL